METGRPNGPDVSLKIYNNADRISDTFSNPESGRKSSKYNPPVKPLEYIK